MTRAGGDRRVLIVDDEQPVRAVLRGMLEAEGGEVLEAEDGESALELLADPARMPDLVIVDNSMPGWSGERTVRALRERFERLPVLCCSGQGEEALAWTHEVGVPVLRKPFRFDDLQHAVRRATSA